MPDVPPDASKSLAALNDPATPGVVLQHIAATHPDLRPQVALHPNTYPDLLTWLAALGDPAVDAALAVRGSAGSTDVAGIKPAPSHPEFIAAPPTGPGIQHGAASAPEPARDDRSHARSRRRTWLIATASVLTIAVAGTAAAVVGPRLFGDDEPLAVETPPSTPSPSTPPPAAPPSETQATDPVAETPTSETDEPPEAAPPPDYRQGAVALWQLRALDVVPEWDDPSPPRFDILTAEEEQWAHEGTPEGMTLLGAGGVHSADSWFVAVTISDGHGRIVAAIDRETGDVRWTAQTGPLWGCLARPDGGALVCYETNPLDLDGHLIVLDGRSGAERARFPTESYGIFDVGDEAIVSLEGHEIIGHSYAGIELWRNRIPDAPDGTDWLGVSIDDGTVIAFLGSSWAVADPTTGELLASGTGGLFSFAGGALVTDPDASTIRSGGLDIVPGDYTSTLVSTAEGLVLVSVDDGDVSVSQPRGGSLSWSMPVRGADYYSTLASDGDGSERLLFRSWENGTFAAVDLDGSDHVTWSLPSTHRSARLLAGGVLLGFDRIGGPAVATDPWTGEEIWRLDLGGAAPVTNTTAGVLLTVDATGETLTYYAPAS